MLAEVPKEREPVLDPRLALPGGDLSLETRIELRARAPGLELDESVEVAFMEVEVELGDREPGATFATEEEHAALCPLPAG